METYRPSGTAPLSGVAMSAVVGIVAAIAIGFVYAYACAYSPLIYLNFLATLAFGGGIGYAVGKAAQAGKVRNPKLMFGLGSLAALIGVYVAWAVDPMARFKLNCEFEPDELFRYMQLGYEHGFWSIGKAGRNNAAVSGIILALVWLIEAGVVIGCAALTASRLNAAQPFCEACDRWTGGKSNVQRLANVANADSALRRVLTGDFTALAEMFRASTAAKDFLQLDLAVCPNCRESNYLTVTRSETKRNSKGKDETKTQAVVKHLFVPYDRLALVLDAGCEPPPIAPPQTTPKTGEPPQASEFNFK